MLFLNCEICSDFLIKKLGPDRMRNTGTHKFNHF